MQKIANSKWKAYHCINLTLLCIFVYAFVYFIGCMYIPFLQHLQCPYLALTGRKCILCGYTRMTIGWLIYGTSINFALLLFIFVYLFQLLLRVINLCFYIFKRRFPTIYYFLDASFCCLMWLACLSSFVVCRFNSQLSSITFF